VQARLLVDGTRCHLHGNARIALQLSAVSGERSYSLDIRIQAIKPSPCQPGLDRQVDKRFLDALPFWTCSFPFRGFPSRMLGPSLHPSGCVVQSGRSNDPGVSRSTPPVLHGDQRYRYATHVSSSLFRGFSEVGGASQQQVLSPAPLTGRWLI
jgi:hypothetical protein